MTIRESLLSINAYPIPVSTVATYCLKRGLEPDRTMTSALFRNPQYLLAEADVMMWLADAPNISQGGQSYSISDRQRLNYQQLAKVIYNEHGEAEDKGAAIHYGYKGDSL